jgi:hypothetical protein
MNVTNQALRRDPSADDTRKKLMQALLQEGLEAEREAA